ncbi:unnamed protein product [Ectocarpus sp. 8 AP-2014]
MIIPVSIDRAAQAAAARETGDGSSKDGNRGVCVPLWSMVELQGELISKDPLSGQPLGSMTSENGKAMLVISNHKLEGKAASEPKPLLVLRKVVVDVNDENCGGSGGSSGATPEGEGDREGEGEAAARRPPAQRVEYRVVGRVARKTIFKTRPKPLIKKLGSGGGRAGGSTARSCM